MSPVHAFVASFNFPSVTESFSSTSSFTPLLLPHDASKQNRAATTYNPYFSPNQARASKVYQQQYNATMSLQHAKSQEQNSIKDHEIYFATCARGLGDVLANEISSFPINGHILETASSGVRFQALQLGPSTGYRAALWLRTAMRVLLQLSETEQLTPENYYSSQRNNSRFTTKNIKSTNLYDWIRSSVDWSHLLDSGSCTFSVRARVSEKSDHHERAVITRTKDAICDSLRDAGIPVPPRPDLHTHADVPVFVVIHGSCATLYLDMCGSSLHKRGYRPDGGIVHRAALNETVAAGMLYLAGFNPDGEWQFQNDKHINQHETRKKNNVLKIVDPMCGGGTLLLEAALLRLRVAVGLYRPEGGFAFERWPTFCEKTWNMVRREAIEMQRSDEEARVILDGGDMHSGAVNLLLRDVKRLRLGKLVQVQLGRAKHWNQRGKLQNDDSLETSILEEYDLAICNPPWGKRINTNFNDNDEQDEVWRELGHFLKRFVPGGRAVVICGDRGKTKGLGMRAEKKFPVRIGNVDTRVTI